jgi:hypothetical protein
VIGLATVTLALLVILVASTLPGSVCDDVCRR